MVGVGLLAGGASTFVFTLLVGLVDAITPPQIPLATTAAVAGVAGLAVAVDGARRSSPSAVVVRCATVVAPALLVAGLALGGYVWIRLGPVAGQHPVARYAPAVPVVLGGLLAAGVGVLGRLFDRHRRRGP
jgi:hypothetical protein